MDQNNTTAIKKPNTTQKEPAMASSDSMSPEVSNQQRSTKKMQVPVKVVTIPDFDPSSNLNNTSLEDPFEDPPRLVQEEPVGESPSPDLLFV